MRTIECKTEHERAAKIAEAEENGEILQHDDKIDTEIYRLSFVAPDEIPQSPKLKSDAVLINEAIDALIANDATTAKSKFKQLFDVAARETS